MVSGQHQALLFAIGLAIAAGGFIGIIFLANRLIAPSNPSHSKGEPYECGLDQAGRPWNSYNVRFSTVAMLFVLFDAEAILLFAVASRLRGDVLALLEVGAFVLFLVLGLAYAWKKGALEWRQ